MSTVVQELPGDLQRIAEVAGVEAAVKIALAFRGTYLYINAMDSLKRLVRDEEIRAAYGRGVKIRDISFRYGLSQRRVRKILDEAPSVGLPEAVAELIKNQPKG
jgi:Mor family transcriptional regulator